MIPLGDCEDDDDIANKEDEYDGDDEEEDDNDDDYNQLEVPQLKVCYFSIYYMPYDKR